MRFYLVLANMTSECVPIRLFTSKAKAIKFVKRLLNAPSEIEKVWPFDLDTDFDADDITYLNVVEFKNDRPVDEFGGSVRRAEERRERSEVE